MLWFTWLVMVLAGLLLVMILLQPDSKGMPPGPKGLPLVGNLLNLLWEEPSKFFSRIADEYGPLCSVQIGLYRVVIINSAPWLQQAFVRQGENFNHRPVGTVLTFVMRGKGIAMSEGEVWKETRRVTLHTFRDFGLGKKSLQNYVDIEVHDFIQALQNQEGKPYDPHHDIATSILNIVWNMIVGERFEMGDKRLRWIVDSLEKSLTLVEQGGFLNFTPILQFMGTFLKPQAFPVLFNLLHRVKYFKELIKKHNDTLENHDRGYDLMYEFLEERKKQLNGGNKDTIFTESQLLWLVSDLFIVGLDTTVTTLRWAILLLVLHPDKQERVFQEISEAFPGNQKPQYELKHKTPYLEAVINEALRYGSIVPIVVHATPADTTLGNFKIPKRTWVIGNIQGIHWDKNTWHDPENFRPERFLDEDGKLKKNDNFVPFSCGRRNCLGESLARVEAYVFLTTMIQHYKITPADTKPEPKYNLGVTLNPVNYKVIFHRRNEF